MKQGYHHKDLRNALIDEAIRLLAEDGPAGLTLRHLGRRLGVTHAAAYAHFPDKNALLREVGNVGFARLAETLASARDDAPDPRIAFECMGRAYVAFARTSPHLYRLMFADDVLAHEPECEPAPIGEEAFALLIEAVAALKAREPESVLEASVTVWATVHGLAMLEIDRRIGFKLDPSADLIGMTARVLLDGLE